MGGIHVAVEVASRDVGRIMTFHKVHPQVQDEVNRRMDGLRRLSVANLQARDAAPKIPSRVVVSWVLEDIITHVISTEIPKVQVAESERKAANLQHSLGVVRDELTEQKRENGFLLTRMKQMEEAKDYMMQTYFREVGTLRQHISELQNVIASNHISPIRAAASPLFPGPQSSTSTQSKSPNRRLAKLTFPKVQPDMLATSGAALADDDALALTLSPTVPPKSPAPMPLSERPAAIRSLNTADLGLVAPTQEVDALFDYERYVAITNEAITSWPERYDALQKRFADTVHHMQVAASSAAMQAGKTITGLTRELLDRETRLSSLTAFVQRFHPIVMNCVRDVKQQLATQNEQLRRDLKAMQLDHVDTVIALSDRIYEVDKRMELFITFCRYSSQKLQHKMRLIQDGRKVKATQGKPLWQFFLLSGKDDEFAEAKAFWQDQEVVKGILESFKQSFLSLERISENNFGPPSDDDESNGNEEPGVMLAKPVRIGPAAPEKVPAKSAQRGGRGRSSGVARGGGKQAATIPSPPASRGGKGARPPSVSAAPPSPAPTPSVMRTTSPSSTPVSPRAAGRSVSPTAGDGLTGPMGATSDGSASDAGADASLRLLSSSSALQALLPKPSAGAAAPLGITREGSVSSFTAKSKGEEFVQTLIRRSLDAKQRRVMCKIRRKVFLSRMPVEVRNMITRLQRLDDEIKSADAAVERYEKRRANTEGKMKKDLVTQSLTTGSLFSSMHSNKRILAAAGGSTSAPVEGNRRMSLASSAGGASLGGTLASMRRRSGEGSGKSQDSATPIAGQASAGPPQRPTMSMESSDFHAFQACSAPDQNIYGGGQQHLSTFNNNSDGVRGITPLSPGEGGVVRSRRASDVWFQDEVPTAEVRRASRQGLGLDSSALCPTSSFPSMSTPLPLVLISTSPQPPLLNALAEGKRGRVTQPVNTPSRDSEMSEMDANVFRIRAIGGRPPTDHYVAHNASSAGGATPQSQRKLYAIPSLPASTSRSLSARSRDVYSHELELRIGSAQRTPLVDELSAQCLLPELRAAGGSLTPRPQGVDRMLRSPRQHAKQ
jgi:hypothetical protein